MATVLDMNERLQRNERERELEEGKAQFLKVFREASPADQAEMIAALENKDSERMMKVAGPIIRRQTIREFN